MAQRLPTRRLRALGSLRASSERLWFLIAQVASRLASLALFAVVARGASGAELGAFALATAIAGASQAMVPAIVAKPLAAGSDDPAEREQRADMAQSAAVGAALAAAAALAVASLLTSGLVRLALGAAAVGVPAVMAVESTFWRLVLTRGARAGGLVLAVSYGVQAALTVLASLVLAPRAVVVAPFVALAGPGLAVLVRRRRLSLERARRWWTTHRDEWVPYVIGVSAGAGLAQATPTLLVAVAGFAAASAYRAAELVFGGTNLLVGVVGQVLLARRSADAPRRDFMGSASGLAVVALLNGAALALVPQGWLTVLTGSATGSLRLILPFITVQRAALGVGSVGAVLLVPLISARRFGTLDVVGASWVVALLVVGGAVGGLRGASEGIAAAEVVLALMYWRLLWRRT